MPSRKKKMISDHVITRLPAYLRVLNELAASDTERISSQGLGKIMGLTASQIRQDFSYFGTFGQQGYGYQVVALRNEIAKIMGLDRNYQAVLLGTGNIGQALLEHLDFSVSGVHIKAAFDVRRELIGTDIAGVPVLDAHDLMTYCQAEGVDIAINCVSAESAQRAAEHAVEAGIRAIWNFTNTVLTVPDHVVVENIFFSDSLQRLEYYLSDMLDSE